MWCTIGHCFVWTRVMLQSRHSGNVLWYEETAEKVDTARIWGSRPSRLHFTLGEKFVLPLQNYLWVKYHFRLYFSHQILPPNWDIQRWMGWSVHFLDWTEKIHNRTVTTAGPQPWYHDCRSGWKPGPWIDMQSRDWGGTWCLGKNSCVWHEPLRAGLRHPQPASCVALSLSGADELFPSREVTSCTTATELENDIWTQAF